MQRKVNMGPPFEGRLHVDCNTNNHFSQLCSAGDLDLRHGYPLMEKTHLDPEL